MKRLIKKAFGKTVYHATTLSNMYKITQDGILRANEGGGLGSVDDFFNEKQVEKMKRPEIKTDRYDGWTFLSDKFDYGSGLINSVTHAGEPLAVLELDLDEKALQKDYDDPNAEESFSIRGDITSEYFKKVYVLDEDNGKPVFEAPFNGWEKKYEKFLQTGEGENPIWDKIKDYGGKISSNGDKSSYDKDTGSHYMKTVTYQNVKIEDVKELCHDDYIMMQLGNDGNIYFEEGDFPAKGGIDMEYNFTTNTLGSYTDDEDTIKAIKKSKKFNMVFESVMSNLMFDSETGQVLLSEFLNTGIQDSQTQTQNNETNQSGGAGGNLFNVLVEKGVPIDQNFLVSSSMPIDQFISVIKDIEPQFKDIIKAQYGNINFFYDGSNITYSIPIQFEVKSTFNYSDNYFANIMTGASKLTVYNDTTFKQIDKNLLQAMFGSEVKNIQFMSGSYNTVLFDDYINNKVASKNSRLRKLKRD